MVDDKVIKVFDVTVQNTNFAAPNSICVSEMVDET